MPDSDSDSDTTQGQISAHTKHLPYVLHNAILSAAIDYGGRHFLVVVYGDADETKCGFTVCERHPHIPPTSPYHLSPVSQQSAEPAVGVSDCMLAATLRIVGYTFKHRSRSFPQAANQQTKTVMEVHPRED